LLCIISVIQRLNDTTKTTTTASNNLSDCSDANTNLFFLKPHFRLSLLNLKHNQTCTQLAGLFTIRSDSKKPQPGNKSVHVDAEKELDRTERGFLKVAADVGDQVRCT
ncbi:hypothetical protein GOODEAATRI_010923, partial [Goodea atripinnis]